MISKLGWQSLKWRSGQQVVRCLRHFCVDLKDYSNCKDYLTAVLKNSSKVNWHETTKNLIGTLPMDNEKRMTLRSHNVNNFIATILSQHDANQVLDYVKHLQTQNISQSPYVSELIFRSWSNKNLREELNEEDRQYVEKLCEQTLAKTNVPERIRCNVLATLANLGQFQEAYQTYQNEDSENFSTTCKLCSNAILNNHASDALKLMQSESFQRIFNLRTTTFFNPDGPKGQKQDEIFCQFIEQFHSKPQLIEELFKIFQDYLYFLNEPVLKLLKRLYKAKKIQLLQNHPHAKCQNCTNHIKKWTFSEKECTDLQNHFRQSLLHVDSKDRVYEQTDPLEWKQFDEFLTKNANRPVDVVIDGMNASLHLQLGRGNERFQREVMVDNILVVLEHFHNLGLGSKICLIHRNWIKKTKAYPEILALCESVFLLDRHSNDDIFCLMAAMNSGPRTMVLTNDTLRQHDYKLSDINFRKLFLKWQFHRVIRMKGSLTREVKLFMPPRHSILASKTQDYWHLPIQPIKKLKTDRSTAIGPKMTNMMAKCFAKGCHQKVTEAERDVSKWRPCLGCRSHWIHIQCGGFCSDCQANNASPIEAMKSTFCSQIKPSTTTTTTTKKSRTSDRSPLSIKQSHIAKRLESSSGFKDGKENSTSVQGKRHRKPTAPPALTPENVDKPSTTATNTTKKNVEPTPNTASNNNKPKNSKKSSSPDSGKTVSTSRKRKLSASNNESTQHHQPAPKKVKRVSNNSQQPSTSASGASTSGGTPKKYASEPHAKIRDKIRKKVVEVKMAEDGTHNPDRLLFHVKTNLPIDNGEPEAEECYDWLRDLSLHQIDDFVDLNEGEKAFMKLWNAHLHLNPCYGDRMLVRILEEFIDEYGIRIYRRNLQRNLTLHLSNMHSFAAISPTTMLELITRFQKLVKDSLDFPEKYPVTPEKVPIENPYYKPKPMSLEDQSLYAKHSNTKSCQNTSNSIDLYQQQASTKQKKSFWVRKCLKKRPMVNNNDEEEDLKLWPRKKSSVTFANELFIDEILDLNDTSSAMTKQSNFISDFNDMYKFTLISPRRNRRSKS